MESDNSELSSDSALDASDSNSEYNDDESDHGTAGEGSVDTVFSEVWGDGDEGALPNIDLAYSQIASRARAPALNTQNAPDAQPIDPEAASNPSCSLWTVAGQNGDYVKAQHDDDQGGRGPRCGSRQLLHGVVKSVLKYSKDMINVSFLFILSHHRCTKMFRLK